MWKVKHEGGNLTHIKDKFSFMYDDGDGLNQTSILWFITARELKLIMKTTFPLKDLNKIGNWKRLVIMLSVWGWWWVCSSKVCSRHFLRFDILEDQISLKEEIEKICQFLFTFLHSPAVICHFQCEWIPVLPTRYNFSITPSQENIIQKILIMWSWNITVTWLWLLWHP